jgi:Ser/Thr protein kinase RdoA (MazF antagonist)
VNPASPLAAAIAWSRTVLGPLEVLDDRTRPHPGHISGTLRLRARSGGCYLKVHDSRDHWESEVYAYEYWAGAFSGRAPRLLAVHEDDPLALLLGELPGVPLEEAQLTPTQMLSVWRSAGEDLAALHSLPAGDCFGPPRRSGGCAGEQIRAAAAYLTAELDHWSERGLRAACLSADELAILRDVRGLITAFEDEPARPCHRDYGPANWLVTSDGEWSGVIDFEFSRWDTRIADFTRYPDWEPLLHPERPAALLEGYGRAFTAQEEQQMLFGHALYALGAVVWGMESAFFIFAEEGRRALRAVAGLL